MRNSVSAIFQCNRLNFAHYMETNRLIYAKLSETFHLLWHCQLKSASSLILKIAKVQKWNEITQTYLENLQEVKAK
jgi:hypothetical protein